jgi:hypothetical protein
MKVKYRMPENSSNNLHEVSRFTRNNTQAHFTRLVMLAKLQK